MDRVSQTLNGVFDAAIGGPVDTLLDSLVHSRYTALEDADDLAVATALAAAAVVLHVAFYNASAHLVYVSGVGQALVRSGRKWIVLLAVYLYAVSLVVSALVRDHVIRRAVDIDAGSLVRVYPALGYISIVLGQVLCGVGALLNLWTLAALGVSGMYNGDSFGILMDSPVSNGPFRLLRDPQYVGTSLFALGFGLVHESVVGVLLAAVVYVVFAASARYIEGPHMARLYGEKNKKRKTKRS